MRSTTSFGSPPVLNVNFCPSPALITLTRPFVTKYTALAISPRRYTTSCMGQNIIVIRLQHSVVNRTSSILTNSGLDATRSLYSNDISSRRRP